VPGATGATGPQGATGPAGTSAINVVDTETNSDFYIPFVSTFIGTTSTLFVDNPGLRFNPSTGLLTATTFSGISNQAKYADLAENYLADKQYEPGTVLSFGGDQEVTESDIDADPAVAGVVSENPAYLMNSDLKCNACDATENVVAVALQGRVMCRVTGIVHKGSLMVAAGHGLARAEANPRPGTIIGKSLENFNGDIGCIEIVVGRT
jgi:hypothetical protein